MRFRKGSKVEVLNKKGLPGSWYQAEIISGNGHTYYVRYDHCLPETSLAMERVPRKVIRPCPPSMPVSRSWVSGDIVEVFENSSWKPAEVSTVVDDGNHFFVKLLGSLRVLRVHVSDLRSRQVWKDDEWIVIGKESEKGNDAKANMAKGGKSSHQKYKPCTVARKCMGDGKFLDNGANCFVEPYGDFLSNMKKRPYFDSRCLGAYGGAGRKMTIARKEGKRQRLDAAHSSNIAGKVDAVVSPPQTMIGEKNMHASLNNSTGFPELGMARENLDDDTIFFSVGSLGSSDSESLSSSVGSCSPSYCPYRLSNHLKDSPVQDAGLPFDDDQTPSGSGSGGIPFSPEMEGLKSEIHQLDLKAYRSTMVAFYVSGPLSWEREAILTNLRLMLHITSDEHLKELRHLATRKSHSA